MSCAFDETCWIEATRAARGVRPRMTAPLALALCLFLPGLARADVPPADGGTSSDSACTVITQSVAGTSCVECVVTSSDTSCQLELGDDYNFACQQSPTVQVWCNGPPRIHTPDPSCAIAERPHVTSRGAALLALVGIALAARRRRRAR